MRKTSVGCTLQPMAVGVFFIRDARKLLRFHKGTLPQMACPPRAWALTLQGDAVFFLSQPMAEA